MQVLEGSPEAVEETMTRIRQDPRHREIDVLSDKGVAAREFGQWSMADRRRGERADDFEARLRDLLRRASPETAAGFLDLLQTA
ncbi:MAG: activator of photopigment and puc with domain protein [Sphingomonas bacterium]|nr:activator of photopigment and puc with domain protein [Sphingomonas bacterium]